MWGEIMTIDEKKLKISNKLYPIFSGLTMDLLFWAAINTIFLTNVKGFSASQMNSMVSVGLIVTILLQSIIFKIIKKIGNIKSIRLGVFLSLISALIFTFANTYALILIGEILYEIAFLFKDMDSVILRKNLKYENKTDDFIKYQSKASTIYSVTTMIIAFLSGFIYRINVYLPMICCVFLCLLNFILSFFMYECDLDKQLEAKNNIKFRFDLLIILLLFMFGTAYSIISVGQTNAKLIMQYGMEGHKSSTQVAIYLSFIIAISRLIRVISNIIFQKIINEMNGKVLYFVNSLLVLAFVLIILGDALSKNMFGIIIVALGFFIFLAIRDPLLNYTKTILLNSCETKYHEKAMVYLTLSNKIGKFIISTGISLLLLKVNIIYAIWFMLIVAIIDVIITHKIYKLTNK